MIDAFMFCNHCSFPDGWYEQDFDRYRLVEESRVKLSGCQWF